MNALNAVNVHTNANLPTVATERLRNPSEAQMGLIFNLTIRRNYEKNNDEFSGGIGVDGVFGDVGRSHEHKVR